jgi:hypothetical protein
MFGTQNMVTQLMPQQPILYCPYYYYTNWCHYGYNTRICGWAYYSCHFGYITITITIYEQAQACLLSDGPPVAVGPGGDPVEALQALRRQLEVTLAGVRAQQEELQRQRAATGGEGGQQGRGGRAARTPRSE